MAGFGKKILSAFVDIEDDDEQKKAGGITQHSTSGGSSTTVTTDVSGKFKNYFDKLFQDSNLPGPDYFEFSKMVEAMQSIPEEKTRYISAFAGLSVQGLSKDKLLQSADKYLQILDKDASDFNSSINNALEDKVELKKKQLQEKSEKIQQLTRDINDLNNSIQLLGNEIKDNEEKIQNNISGYGIELNKFKGKIQQDIQKITNLL